MKSKKALISLLATALLQHRLSLPTLQTTAIQLQ